MVLKSFAKINLNLLINKKQKNGLHDLQSIYCLTDLHDKIIIKKIKNKNKDLISFSGPFSINVSDTRNSVKTTLNVMRKYKLISDYYSVYIHKNIPVFAGLGGGTSNAATIIQNLTNKRIKKKLLNKIIHTIGSDLILFFYKYGYLSNIKIINKIRYKYKLYFVLIFPNIKCSTRQIYSKLKNYSKKTSYSKKEFSTKNKFVRTIKDSKNDLQSIVEKQHPIIKKVINSLSAAKGCCFSRMTGSGSVCYGLFTDKKCAKVAFKKLRKKYPKFWLSFTKTI